VTVRSLRHTLAAYRAGSHDPTTRLSGGSFMHATLTPEGPATLLLGWGRDPAPVSESLTRVEAWGPGSDWLIERVDRMAGTHDSPDAASRQCEHLSPTVARALRSTRTTHLGASDNLYHLLLPTVIAQRITAGEALRQWGRLCRATGEPAPGPRATIGDLLLPPHPELLLRRPTWWFHRLGIEVKRARALIEVARHHDKLWAWSRSGSAAVTGKLGLLPGIGPWTVGSVLGPALGDPDAVPIGDFHFPNIVAWNLAGEPRADDDRMLELLEPYRGQRGRVLHALVRAGRPAPAFGPRRRTLQIQHL
jgi:3-methyladenine DNA glycosylase/8-oxoguanine DNA glycosylase